MSTAGNERLQPHCPNRARDLLARLGRLLPRWYSHPTRATQVVDGGSVHLNLGVAPPDCCVCLLCNSHVGVATPAVLIPPVVGGSMRAARSRRASCQFRAPRWKWFQVCLGVKDKRDGREKTQFGVTAFPLTGLIADHPPGESLAARIAAIQPLFYLPLILVYIQWFRSRAPSCPPRLLTL